MSVHKGLYDFVEDDYTRNMLDDLQLAAELGKTLLERNKELENALKQHQNIIEDQTQEIEYLTKQTVALREVNDSRLRIYEQLEISIQDLERANHRLAVENSTDKKHIKSLTSNVETLEFKCDDLQSTIDDLRIQVDILKRRAQRPIESPRTPPTAAFQLRRRVDYGSDEVDSTTTTPAAVPKQSNTSISPPTRQNEASSPPKEPETNEPTDFENQDADMEQMTQLLTQLRETRSQCNKDQRRITELEEQLATLVKQNETLENQIIQMHSKDEDIKSMHEEFTTLEEVRQGQMCSRCLRSMYRAGEDNASVSVCSDPEDEDASMLEALCDNNAQYHRSSFTMDVQEYNAKTFSPNTTGSNLYRDLVQKYEALLEIHRQPATRTVAKTNSNCLSLHEELQMSGDFDTLSTKDTDEESGHGDSLKPENQHKKVRKTFSHTPTDFSEAETSSSGFADETSNKFTQTDERPGSFLCTIADGEDCKFSIYDDASPIDSRFRNRPEYRELFKEIFTVLKKAAENKDEGEELPLLDDHTPVKSVPKVPPVTPSNDTLPDFPDFNDDTQSILSSTMSELSVNQVEQSTTITLEETQIEESVEVQEEPELILKPLVRPPLEYISVGVNIRKRSSSRRKNKNADRSDSPITHILGSPKITYASRSGRKSQRDLKNKTESENWNGNTLQFWSSKRSVVSPTPSQGSGKNVFEYKPSSASQDLHKLKRLDLSYAEVLRSASTKNKQKDVGKAKRKI